MAPRVDRRGIHLHDFTDEIMETKQFKKSMDELAEASGKYVGSLASNIAAVATAAEVNKARDLVVQMGQHALCNPGKA